MSANGPAVYVTIDEQRGLALLRGREAERVAYLISPADFSWAPMFVPSGRGWIIPATAVADVTAWGQASRELVVTHRRRDPP